MERWGDLCFRGLDRGADGLGELVNLIGLPHQSRSAFIEERLSRRLGRIRSYGLDCRRYVHICDRVADGNLSWHTIAPASRAGDRRPADPIRHSRLVDGKEKARPDDGGRSA